MQYRLGQREARQILLDEGWTIMTYGGEVISVYAYSDKGHTYFLPLSNFILHTLDRNAATLTDEIGEVYYEFDPEQVAHIWLRDIRFRGGEADFTELVDDAQTVERRLRSLFDAFKEEFDDAI